MCYAVQLAFDSASDPVYNNGWQAGDNGGTGFTPWNFDAGYWWQGNVTAYDHPGFHAIDDGLKSGTHYSNPFNDIGRSWAVGSPSNSDGAPRYGRGFPALQIGQTFSVTVDNPTKRQFYKGYFVQLNGNSGGVNGNICNGGHSCTNGGTAVNKLTLWRFEYFNYGVWKLGDNSGDFDTSLYDTDTASGMRFDVTRTGTDDYSLTVTPLGTNPPAPYTHTGTFRNPGTTVDWFSIVFFNTFTDIGTPPNPGDINKNGYVDAADYVTWRKTAGTPTQLSDWKANFGNAVTPTNATDFYIHRMEITSGSGSGLGQGVVPEPGCDMLVLLGAGTLLACGTALSRRG
jgi:hypothetical protein